MHWSKQMFWSMKRFERLIFSVILFLALFPIWYAIMKATLQLIEGHYRSALAELIDVLLNVSELIVVTIPSRIMTEPIIGIGMLAGIAFWVWLIVYSIRRLRDRK